MLSCSALMVLLVALRSCEPECRVRYIHASKTFRKMYYLEGSAHLSLQQRCMSRRSVGAHQRDQLASGGSHPQGF
jgi:hypothetical protein